MTCFLQINLNKCRAAQDLMVQTAAAHEVDIMLVSEYYKMPKNDSRWTPSTDGTCAVVTSNTADLVATRSGAGPGYAWAEFGKQRCYSCYKTPNCLLPEFLSFLADLESSVRNTNADM